MFYYCNHAIFYSRYPGETVSLGASRNSLANDEDHDENGVPYYDIHDLPPLGTCTALYAFEGNENFSFILITVNNLKNII